MRGERGQARSAEIGQATLEWVGLVLLAALVLGGLTAFRGATRDPKLGDSVAERITCAARGGCPPARGRSVPGRRPRPGVPGRRPPPALSGAVAPARAADAFQRLRGVAEIGKRTWIVCLGYQRWRYELEHPRPPQDPLPVREALRIANACLNPYSFLTEK